MCILVGLRGLEEPEHLLSKVIKGESETFFKTLNLLIAMKCTKLAC